MATTTPNFGWPVPTSTDLVKDGATAIEALGDGIDASLLDLKGGTTGQVLKKNTNTDMDFVWSSDAAGMTNPMTTTGDTIYSSSGSTPARLGIGATGNVLTVAGGVPTWAAPSGGGTTSAFNATKSSNQSLSASTWTKITWDATTFNIGSTFSTADDKLTTTRAGLWQFGGNSTMYGSSAAAYVRLYVNGVASAYNTNNGSYAGIQLSQILNLASGDYVELYAFWDAGGSPTYDATASNFCAVEIL
jgi:hypothetical protein